jgi:DNA-binding NtrC family response regulator
MSLRALVVDDDRSMVKTLSDVLQFKGWEVSQAYSGAEAVSATANAAFDVVLMDIKMPGMDGVEASKAIKARDPAIRVVLMTAYAAQDRLAEAEQQGIRILPKPVNLALLFELLTASRERDASILVIDTDAAFLKTLSEVLRLRGYEIVIAEHLEAAKRLMATRHPIAVLLHMHLGPVSAREAVVAVHELNPDAALILYSGRVGAQTELQLAVPATAIHAYLQKPFAIDEVTGVLDAIRDDG